jgi:hypothetical protein
MKGEAMSDWVIQYSAKRDEFRLSDGAGCFSDVYDVQSDGVCLVKLEGDEEDPDPEDEDIVLLVATHNYTGEDFEPNTVYDIDATETEVEEGVDLTLDPPDVEVEESDDDD